MDIKDYHDLDGHHDWDWHNHSEYGMEFSLAVSPFNAAPEAQIIRSDTDNSVKITWSDDSIGTLNGNSYTKNTWIITEGNYSFILKNAEEETATYTFSITHYYVAAVVAPTCIDRGYTRHTCKHCGGTYDTDSVPMTGHKYVESTVRATCGEDGGLKHTCTICDYYYMTDIEYADGHSLDTVSVIEATCTSDGLRHEKCELCHEDIKTVIAALGHSYNVVEVIKSGKNTKRKLECSHCGDSRIEDLGNQYERVGAYVEMLFSQYKPYLGWVLTGTAGVWSIFIGISYIIAQKNEEKEKAKKMLLNYVIGLVAIFFILVACPLLIRGITALVT